MPLVRAVLRGVAIMSFLRWQRRAREIAAHVGAGPRGTDANRARLSLAVEALVARTHGAAALDRFFDAKIIEDSLADLAAWLRQTLRDPALEGELDALAQRHDSADPAPFVLEHITHALDPRARVGSNLYSTPEPVARWMARAALDAMTRHFRASSSGAVGLDPACGSGALLLALARESRGSMKALYGIERDPVAHAAGALHARLSLHDSAVSILRDDTLSRSWREHRRSIAPHRAGDGERPLVVVANPPFASTEPINDWLATLVRGRDPRSPSSYRRREGDPPLRNTKWLDTAQLRFLRWIHDACDAAPEAVAVVALGHAWVDHPTFAPVRRALCEGFDEVSVVDLHGAARHGLETPDGGRDQNLFEIQQGLCLLILGRGSIDRRLASPRVRRADLWGTRAEKLAALEGESLGWQPVEPSAPTWSFSADERPRARAGERDDAVDYHAAPSLSDVFESDGSAIISGRDAAVLAYDEAEILRRIDALADSTTARGVLRSLLGARAFDKLEGPAIDAIVERARDRSLVVRRWHYRPWDVRFAIDDRSLVDRPRTGSVIDALRTEKTLAIVTRRQSPPERPWNYLLVVREPPCDGVLRADPHGTEVVFTRERLERGSLTHNFKSAWLDEFARRQGAKGGAALVDEAFAFVIGVLMNERYRRRFGALLCKGVPRVCWPSDGEELAERVREGAYWIRAHTGAIDEVSDVRLRGASEAARIEYATLDASQERVMLGQGLFIEGVTLADMRSYVGARRPALRWLEDRVGSLATPALESEYRRVIARVRARYAG